MNILNVNKATLIACSCFLALYSSVAWSEVAIPDTPAGRALAMRLEAFNSGAREKMDAYFKKYYPSGSVDDAMQFRRSTGGLDLLEVLKSDPRHIEFLLKERASETRVMGKLDLTEGESGVVRAYSLRALPPGVTRGSFTIDAATRARVIDGAVAMLKGFYVFPDSAQKMEDSIRKRQKLGEYNAVTDGDVFANLLTQNLREISHDKHLRVNFSPAPLPIRDDSEQSPESVAQFRKEMESTNCFFSKVERLTNNIGYVKFDAFIEPEICGQTVVAAMNFLANVDALIFDLRDNGGGEPAMVAFISSYLFSEQTHLNDIWERKSGVTRQFWTLPYVPGKNFGGKPVYVLTSARTFSGGEEFVYNLKSLKRATIVGETTGGGAHPVAPHRIDERFMIGVPFARAINPITKTNWEGTGVEPDVKVPAADALSKAQQLATDQLRSQ